MMSVSANKEQLQHGESGFVLVTSIIMLSLLTLMSVGMYFVSKSGTQTSAAAQTSTKAYYYVESAIHYMTWALVNDAEFDNHTYSSGSYVALPFGEPAIPTSSTLIGDFLELQNYLWNPGPTGNVGSSAIVGQVKYFDNSPMASRYLCMEDATFFSNCMDVSLSPGDSRRVQPSMYRISAILPRYIKLDIAPDGVITPSIPQLPHRAKPVVGEDIPLNGAIIWLTAADPNNNDHDMEIFPLTPTAACKVASPANQCPSACVGSNVLGECPCTAPVTLDPTKTYKPDPADPQYNFFMAAQACNANPYQSDDPTSPNYLATTDLQYVSPWLPSYSIVAYAIGYVNGKPSHMLRAIIK